MMSERQRFALLVAAAVVSATAPAVAVEPMPRPAPEAGPATRSLGTIVAGTEADATPSADVGNVITGTVTPSVSAAAVSARVPAGELSIVKEAIARLRKGDLNGANALRAGLRHPVARGVVDWATVRFASRQMGVGRLEAFLQDNPTWPGAALVRRRTEEALFLEDPGTDHIARFFAASPPISAMGRLALATVKLQAGDRAGAQRLVRDAWRSDDLSSDVEKKVMARFGGLLTAEDHRVRAMRLFFEGEREAGLRAATLAGSGYAALGKARAAVDANAKNAKALMNAVPSSVRREPLYLLSLIQMNRRADKNDAAIALMLKAPRNPGALVDPDAWWEERRILARRALDAGDAKTAYRLAAEHAAVSPENRSDAEFHAGWIALRFLKDPATAQKHFAAIDAIAMTPMTIARANYWLGRTAEARGDMATATARYQTAARHMMTYYGQLASAKLGKGTVSVRGASATPAARAAVSRLPGARAIEVLYAIGERDLTIPLFSELAATLHQPAEIAALAEIAQENNDARALLLVGKTAVQNGHPLEAVAWPVIGIPSFKSVVTTVETPMVYAIARQESAFHAAAMSRVGARGLMQMMPDTAKRTAKAFGLPYAVARLTSDPAYNATLGSAHLAQLLDEYNGSYIMTFAAYNAGGSRVKQWVAAYGDPRDPSVDPVDWVERIPFTETRNYVQRVMENVLMYRARLGARTTASIEADLRRGMASR